MANSFSEHKIVVIKIGTSSLLDSAHCMLNLVAMAGLTEAVRRLKDANWSPIIVSSGAVGAGCQKLGLTKRPDDVSQRQALASIGQPHLMRHFTDMFSAAGLTCSQVLLTLDNLADEEQYHNAAATFQSLLDFGVVPVVNENDTVAVEQLRIGDNDTLSAQVATLVQAEWLFLLTDVDALYTSNPNTDPSARLIREVADVMDLNVATEDGGQAGWGTGGMATKLTAAATATAAGSKMVIVEGSDPDIVPRIVLDGEISGTTFLPACDPVQGEHQRWILSAPPRGEIQLRHDAAEGLRLDGAAPVPMGSITEVRGDFGCGDAVVLCDEEGTEVGRGVARVSSHSVIDSLNLGCGDGGLFDSAAERKRAPVVVVEQSNVCVRPTFGDGTTSSKDGATSAEGDSGLGSVNMAASPTSITPSKWTSSTTLDQSSTQTLLELAATRICMDV